MSRREYSRRQFIRSLSTGLGGIGLGLAGFSEVGKTAGGEFRFVHMTDMHVQPELDGEKGLRAAIKAVNRLDPRPDLVITGGDLVMDALGQPYERADRLFNMFDECCGELKMPVHNCIGNHDVFGWYPKSGVSADHPEFGKRMFEKRLGNGRSYKSFDHNGWHFILLDSIQWDEAESEYTGLIDPEQLAWLKADLVRVGTKTPVVVVTHLVLASIRRQVFNGANDPLPPTLGITNSMDVLNSLEGYNLKFVLQGHLHKWEHCHLEDRVFITSGAVAGDWWKGPYGKTQEGFLVVDVNGDGGYRFDYHDYGWEV
jgi:3',5'-cyclic AMP phosphodiesterase CpdA